MAFGEGGKFFKSGAKMRQAERAGEEKHEENKAEGEGRESEGAEIALHSNSDGTHKTVIGGNEEEHPTLQHALMHIAHHEEPAEKHMMHSHDGYGVKSHGIDEGGKHDGPHEHENVEEAKEHMGKFFGEEGGKMGHEENEQEPEAHGLY